MFNFCIDMENTNSEHVNEGKKGTKFQWIAEEDDKLVECLLELTGDVKWKADNGFKPRFIAKLEELMEKKLLGCGIKASPHIESRYKTLRRQYRAIADMLGPNASGFGWNDNEKMVVVEKIFFEDWVKVILFFFFFAIHVLKTNFYFIIEFIYFCFLSGSSRC